MPYVGRNSQGTIVAVATQATETTPEFIDGDALELHNFVGAVTSPGDDLARSDQSMIRVLDDLIMTLIDKNLLRFTDLPPPAQSKLMKRSSLRRSAQALDLLETDNPFSGKL